MASEKDKPFIWEPSPYTAQARRLAKMDEDLRVEMRAQELAEKKRGGARPGAGRKKVASKRVVLSCRVAPATRTKLQGIAKETGGGIGSVIDFILDDYEKRVAAE
jgi:hypothetical protein